MKDKTTEETRAEEKLELVRCAVRFEKRLTAGLEKWNVELAELESRRASFQESLERGQKDLIDVRAALVSGKGKQLRAAKTRDELWDDLLPYYHETVDDIPF